MHYVNGLIGGAFGAETKLSRADFISEIMRKMLLYERGKYLIPGIGQRDRAVVGKITRILLNFLNQHDYF